MKMEMGWIEPLLRTPEQERCHDQAMFAMPKLSLPAKAGNEEAKVDLTELWETLEVIEALGWKFPGVYQQTGSCVGAGLGNAAFTLCCVEVLRLADPEKIIVPFWLLPYGRSRLYGGMRTPGEGSFGSTAARAAKEDGFLDARQAGLPMFTNEEGLVWSENTERSWSDGDAQQTLDLLPESRKHLVGTVSQVRNTDELEQGIRNLYPATNASSLIPNVTIGDDGEAYGKVARSGGHQTTFLGVWKHPSKGRLFKYVNQWSTRWGKKGACWIPDSDAQAIINDGQETFLFSQYQGYPVQSLDWRKIA